MINKHINSLEHNLFLKKIIVNKNNNNNNKYAQYKKFTIKYFCIKILTRKLGSTLEKKIIWDNIVDGKAITSLNEKTLSLKIKKFLMNPKNSGPIITEVNA
tara:strand:- start:237 stop:539 length:303 start_codon:yes stop_codon:yes gene_type:complete